jgi:hypothetical protein
MTKAEWLLVKSTIDRLSFLAPIAEEKGNMLVSASTLTETVECLRMLMAEAKKLEDLTKEKS